MAIAHRGWAQPTSDSYIITVTATQGSPQSGDYRTFVCANNSNVAVTPPSGWTQIGFSTDNRHVLFGRTFQSGDGDAVFTLATQTIVYCALGCFSGVDPEVPLDTALTAAPSLTGPSVTTVTDGAMLIGTWSTIGNDSGGTTISSPNNMTDYAVNAGRFTRSVTMAYEALSAVGATGTRTATATGTTGTTPLSAMFALRPAAAAAAAPRVRRRGPNYRR